MSERARALEQAREWQAIAYGDRPETWAALDYYRELGWPVDSNKFPERERVEGRIFAFMSGYREALKAAVDPPPSGASPQSVPCHCGGVMFGDGSAHTKECPCFEGAKSVDAPIYRQVYIVTHYPEGGLRGVHASQAGAEAEIAELCREYPDYTRQDFSIVCDRIRPNFPSGASPQAETSEDMGDGWYVTVGRWGESLVTIEQRCLSGKADFTDDDAALIRGAAKHLQQFIGQPAPVSSVEPEPATTCHCLDCEPLTNPGPKPSEDDIDRLEKAAWDSKTDRVLVWYRDRAEMFRQRLRETERAWQLDRKKPTVEPEPPTNPPCVRCGHALSAHRPEFGACDGRDRPCACPEYQVPTVEPEPCVWRMGGHFGDLRVAHDAYFYVERIVDWKFCPYCGAPLKVEREP